MPIEQLSLFTPRSEVISVRQPDPPVNLQPRGAAWFSPCGKYRYTLSRVIDPANERTLVSIGVNPSDANAIKDDNTIRKDIGFAKRWGCGRLVKANPYAYVATDPDDMHAAQKAGIDIIGPDNETALRQSIGHALLTGGILLLACGNDLPLERLREIMPYVRFGGVQAMCLGTNKNGSPKHNLYLPYSTPLVPYPLPWATESEGA